MIRSSVNEVISVNTVPNVAEENSIASWWYEEVMQD